MTKDRSHLTDRQLTEEWQEFESEHLRRQTAALESIRTVLITMLMLGVVALVLVAAASL